MIVADTTRQGRVNVGLSGDAISLSHEFTDIVSMLLSKLSRESLLEIVSEAEAFEEGDEEDEE